MEGGGKWVRGGGRTKSARESSSCPIILLFFLQRATLPSRASKAKPNGRKTSAAHRLP